VTIVLLNEPVITTLVKLLSESLGGVIAEINAATADDFIVEPPVKVIDYMPISLTLEQGMPLVAVQDLPITFENDLQHSMESEVNLGICSILQTADHRTLAWQLRRYNQAVMQAIQNDRQLNVEAIMRKPPASVIYTEFVGTEPGPMLGDRNPDDPGAPPTSFRSWTWLIIKCRRQEVLT
jgi:hypothetical protein